MLAYVGSNHFHCQEKNREYFALNLNIHYLSRDLDIIEHIFNCPQMTHLIVYSLRSNFLFDNFKFNKILLWHRFTVYPKKYAHGFCFAVLCCGYKLSDFPISIRLTSLALWQSNDCPSASKATLKNMDKYFKWIHYERLHNHNKAKHNKTVCIFLGIYCTSHNVFEAH